MIVPWNAMWSGEARYEIRPCRWAQGRLAVHSPHCPGSGRPIFAKPHAVRQRRSVAQWLCTVCGDPTAPDDRWWFALGSPIEAEGRTWFATTEAPVHRRCADLALEHCPHLRRQGHEADLSRFPDGHSVLYSIVGGSEFDAEFSLRAAGRNIVGALKFAWPASRIRIQRRPAA